MDAATDTACEQRLAAHGEVRVGSSTDAVLGTVPARVAAPGTPQDVAACLAIASQHGLRTVLRGSGSKLGWARAPDRVDLLLDLRRLNRVTAHQHGDLTATIEGGASIGEVNRELGRHRQWLPQDSAGAQATIGGLIATNDSGPLRHRYGTPRDQLIGVTLATTDGRLVKAGGQVVKNVAGYDLGRLVCGSNGAFAAIVAATFKLAPWPRCSKTVVAAFASGEALTGALAALIDSPLEPMALEVHVSTPAAPASAQRRLLVRFGSTPRAVDVGLEQLRPLLGSAALTAISAEADQEYWEGRSSAIWASPGSIVRAAWLPATLAVVLPLLEELSVAHRLEVEIVGRAALGAGLIRLEGAPLAEVRAIERLREAASPVQHVTLLRGSGAVRDRVDVWEPLGDRAAALKALKKAFDPDGILNAGRGPV